MLDRDKFLLANPADEDRARHYAHVRQLPLELNELVPEGSVFLVDPQALRDSFVGLEPRSVGICSRCATDVLLRPGKGASCACGSMQIPPEFFEGNRCS